MTDTYQEKDHISLGAFFTGALMGAATIALMNKNTRETIRNTVDELLTKGGHVTKDIEENIHTMSRQGRLKLAEELQKTADKLKSAPDTEIPDGDLVQ